MKTQTSKWPKSSSLTCHRWRGKEGVVTSGSGPATRPSRLGFLDTAVHGTLGCTVLCHQVAGDPSREAFLLWCLVQSPIETSFLFSACFLLLNSISLPALRPAWTALNNSLTPCCLYILQIFKMAIMSLFLTCHLSNILVSSSVGCFKVEEAQMLANHFPQRRYLREVVWMCLVVYNRHL